MHHYVHLFVHGLHALTVYGNLVFLHVHLVADLRADGLDLLVDERLRQFGGGDANHVVGALVGIHVPAPSHSGGRRAANFKR